ncbi:MAG TPA: hypothetical protein VFF15_00395 [Flavobacteriaceae bacterium]|nr:hypothetical protein [Flavobacteriaceae bacterium]
MKLQNDIKNDPAIKQHTSDLIMLVRDFFRNYASSPFETVNELLHCRMADYEIKPLTESEVRELVYMVSELTLFLSALSDKTRRLELCEQGYFLRELGYDFKDIEKAMGYIKN